ncbi:cytochrome P450 2G1-like [Discoglossus pictus]
MALIGLLTISWWKKSLRRHLMLPPGPPRLPLIGNLHQVKPSAFLKSLLKLSEKYGSVYTLYFGSSPIVMLCGYDAVKEALIDHGDSFIGRGKMPLADYVMKGYGILASNGERWKQLRRFSLTTLRNFGMGKRSTEERIQEEAHYLVKKFRETQCTPFDPHFHLGCSASNIICSILFGHRFEYEDKQFLSLLNNISEFLKFMNSTWGLVYFNFHKLIGHLPGPQNRGINHLKELTEYIEERIRYSQETLDPDSPQHFLECFLAKMLKEEHNPLTEYNMDNLVNTAVALFFAGTDTISATLRYGFLFLLKHPEIQGQMQKEIDCVIGRQRCPSMDDRNQMPYTDAVIHEIQRHSDIIPTGIPHATIRDVSFRGYLIPKGTDVYPLLTTVLQDPGQFPKPEEFCPERFLDEQGKLKKISAFMPFSTGNRMCLGEGLARQELFLFLTSILQSFTLNSQVPSELLDLTPHPSSAGHHPRSYLMSITPRSY